MLRTEILFIEKENMMNKQEVKLQLVLCQEWTEYERGWGRRPDGCSIHASEEDRKVFCADHWARMPERGRGPTPDEYSIEEGAPYLAIVSDALYGELQQSTRKGVWVFQGGMRAGAVRKATRDEMISTFRNTEIGVADEKT